jgi:PAS domain S-box-containing protein
MNMGITKSKILIVDDKEENLLAIKQTLLEEIEDPQIEIYTSTTGLEALKVTLHNDFALIILDVEMPEMDGFELAEFLRGKKKTQSIPLMFISAVYSSHYTVMKGYATGAVDFLTKPIDSRVFVNKIKTFIQMDQQKKELEQQREWLDVTLRSIGDAVIASDQEHRVTFMNPLAVKLTGWNQKDALGKNLAEVLNVKDQDVNDMEKHLAQNAIIEGPGIKLLEDQMLIGKHGLEVPISGNLAPIKVKESKISGSVLVFRDISKTKQAEAEKSSLLQQLQQTQRQKSIENLSSGIAHNFNNILGVIIGSCDLTKQNFQTAEIHIPVIEAAAERAAELCTQMMAYSDKYKLIITKVNMAMQVDETVVMLKSSLPKNTVMKTNLSASIPLIEGDVSQLSQMVMNLVINASEAIGTEQGEVKVSVDKFDVIAGKTFKDYNGQPIPSGDYVCLEVTDNGCGMDETTIARSFEPFYTTKFTGRGLGMSSVLGIIQAHAGALQVFSELGQGTTFKMYLPAIEEVGRDVKESTSTASVAWQGSGTILLVEDEAELRLIAKELLERCGFTVLEAVNGMHALEIYQKNAKRITLVFTDIGMPVMDGYELFEKLKKLTPELPIFISSGYGDSDVNARIISDDIAGIISKPYNADKLQEGIGAYFRSLLTPNVVQP